MKYEDARTKTAMILRICCSPISINLRRKILPIAYCFLLSTDSPIQFCVLILGSRFVEGNLFQAKSAP